MNSEDSRGSKSSATAIAATIAAATAAATVAVAVADAHRSRKPSSAELACVATAAIAAPRQQQQ